MSDPSAIAGQPVLPFTGERFTVAELMAYDGIADIPADFIRRVLATPVRRKTRAKLEALLTP